MKKRVCERDPKEWRFPIAHLWHVTCLEGSLHLKGSWIQAIENRRSLPGSPPLEAPMALCLFFICQGYTTWAARGAGGRWGVAMRKEARRLRLLKFGRRRSSAPPVGVVGGLGVMRAAWSNDEVGTSSVSSVMSWAEVVRSQVAWAW